VLRALAEWLPPGTPCPFDVLVGTSAGAVNSAALAARAENLTAAVDTLEGVWSQFRVEQVVRADNISMLVAGLRWMVALASGGRLAKAATRVARYLAAARPDRRKDPRRAHPPEH
jgi:NTE family protein